jgi:RHS repeat-associated protein
LLREYVWNVWEPVAVIEGGVISFVRADHIGRPVFATNSTGTKVWTATYQPFGGVHTSTGTIPTARFPGQWFQSESGLHQNWMRDYDPTTGRYLQADPLGLIDGASVYGYAGQSPMMNMDPTGQCFGPWAIACAAAAWGAVSVYVGWLLDPDCYTWQEGLRDFTVGFAFGGFGQAWNAAWKAGAGGSAAYGAWNAARSGVGANKAAGDAFRDVVAEALKQAGKTVDKEVFVPTPFGGRIVDLVVSSVGKVVGHVETKLGNFRYLPSQRTKDFWIEVTTGVKTTVVRWK